MRPSLIAQRDNNISAARPAVRAAGSVALRATREYESPAPVDRRDSLTFIGERHGSEEKSKEKEEVAG
jgi:hypothetical protein